MAAKLAEDAPQGELPAEERGRRFDNAGAQYSQSDAGNIEQVTLNTKGVMMLVENVGILQEAEHRSDYGRNQDHRSGHQCLEGSPAGSHCGTAIAHNPLFSAPPTGGAFCTKMRGLNKTASPEGKVFTYPRTGPRLV